MARRVQRSALARSRSSDCVEVRAPFGDIAGLVGLRPHHTATDSLPRARDRGRERRRHRPVNRSSEEPRHGVAVVETDRGRPPCHEPVECGDRATPERLDHLVAHIRTHQSSPPQDDRDRRSAAEGPGTLHEDVTIRIAGGERTFHVLQPDQAVTTRSCGVEGQVPQGVGGVHRRAPHPADLNADPSPEDLVRLDGESLSVDPRIDEVPVDVHIDLRPGHVELGRHEPGGERPVEDPVGVTQSLERRHGSPEVMARHQQVEVAVRPISSSLVQRARHHGTLHGQPSQPCGVELLGDRVERSACRQVSSHHDSSLGLEYVADVARKAGAPGEGRRHRPGHAMETRCLGQQTDRSSPEQVIEVVVRAIVAAVRSHGCDEQVEEGVAFVHTEIAETVATLDHASADRSDAALEPS